MTKKKTGNVKRGGRRVPTGMSKTLAKKIVAADLRHWDMSMKSLFANDRDKFRRYNSFRKGIREDLAALCQQGVIPDIVLHIMFAHYWLLPGVFRSMETRDKEIRKLGSAGYWRRATRSLERAEKFLEEFTDNRHFKMADEIVYEDGPPPRFSRSFIRFCHDAERAHDHIQHMLWMIGELKLEQTGWTGLDGRAGKHAQEPKIGRKKSGPARLYDWGECALLLHLYLKMLTGRPNWETIARMLHFSGDEDFPAAILPSGYSVTCNDEIMKDNELLRGNYVDRIRDRVRRLKKDEEAMKTAEKLVAGFKDFHENEIEMYLFSMSSDLIPRPRRKPSATGDNNAKK